MAEKITKEEAINILTMRRDQFNDARKDGEFELALSMLEYAGDAVGYAPAFRCLVKGMEPEQAVAKWR